MAQEQQVTGLNPGVVFSLDAIIAAQGLSEMDEATPVDTGFELNPRDVVVEAYQEVTGMTPAKAPDGEAHSLFPAAGAGAVIFSLQQLQPWLSTIADLAQLGALGLRISQKLREKLGADSRAVVFSKEIVEGMCLQRLQGTLGTELTKVSLRSHEFDRYSGEPVTPQYRMNGTAIYLIWIRVETTADTYLFLVDAWGKVWGEWDTWGVSHSDASKSSTNQ